MKKALLVLSLFALGIAAGFTFSNAKDYAATQNDLDKTVTPAKLGSTGKPYGEVSISHDGRGISADSSIRDSYTNLKMPGGTIEPGTIFTKRAYAKKKDGSRGDLVMLFAMIKHEKGYYPAGGDWEYVSIPYDKSVDYKIHPNGMLPAMIDDNMRGKVTSCANCHSSAMGNDFVFTNSPEPVCKPNGGSCKPKGTCGPCKPKCGPCKPKMQCNPCQPKCSPCKPKAQCNPCQPKCSPCKPKAQCSPCKPKTVCNPCKPKAECNPCKPKCNPCKPKPECNPCKPKL